MLRFLRGIRRGVVTTRYPRVRDGWAQQLPTPPAFHPDQLTPELAGRLAEACAAGALRVQDGDLLLDLGTCTGCGDCIAAGGGAVARSGEFELASHDRTALVKRIQIGDRR